MLNFKFSLQGIVAEAELSPNSSADSFFAHFKFPACLPPHTRLKRCTDFTDILVEKSNVHCSVHTSNI